MCRLMAYMGDPLLLAHVVLWPDRSIIKQSYDARERKLDPSLPFHLALGNLNGDGFGIGWYTREAESLATTPCVFTSVTPAWNNDNLARLAGKITSPLMFAHVRAAYPGMPVSEQNCHPFQWGRYMWMHNGVISGFSKIRRQLLSVLCDEAYDAVPSFHSDSAVGFALFLHHLPDKYAQLTPDALLQAMEKCLATIASVQESAGVKDTSLLNFVVSDGTNVVALRYVSPDTDSPASLYYAEGSAFKRSGPEKNISASKNPSSLDEAKYELAYGERGNCVAIVASEPITGSTSDWVEVPKNTALVISREKSGFVNIMRAPVTATGKHSLQHEVLRCLEAVSRGIGVTARQWSVKHGRSLASKIAGVNDAAVTQKEDWRLTGHEASVLYIVPDNEGKRLFSASLDGSIKVWDLEAHVLLHEMKGHNKPVLKMAIYGNRLYSTGGRRVRVWDLDTYECVYVAQTRQGMGTLRAIAVENDVLYVGSQDTGVKATKFDPDRFTPKCEEIRLDDDPIEFHSHTWPDHGHLSTVNSVEVCGRYVCSAGGDAMIRVWHLDSLSPVAVLRGHRGSILTLKGFGNMLLSGGRDNTVRVWDMEALLCRRTLTGHKDDVSHIAVLGCRAFKRKGKKHRRGLSMLPDGPCLVATASADCTVRLWSTICWSCLQIFNLGPPWGDFHGYMHQQENPPESTAPLALAMNAQHLMVGTREGVINLYSIEEFLAKLLEMVQTRELEQSSSKELADASDEVVDDCNGELRRKQIESEMEKSLKKFVRLKTVSGDPQFREDCFKGAKFVAHLLESLGAEVKLVQPFDDRNPVVIGRLGNNPDKPTVAFYAHYDVQPATEPQWQTDPFELHPIDGYFYARGASDNKGPILAFIYAVKELLETHAECDDGVETGLPLNVAFIFEGEEESGSKGTVEALEQNLRWFEGTVLTVISNTQWVGENVPCLTYGMRGMLSLNVEVHGPDRDLHSGNDGGVFNEPLVDLVRVLATLVDGHNGILIPNFYRNVKNNLMKDAWPGLKHSQEFSVEGYKSALGVPGLTFTGSKWELLNARWCQPTLSVVDLLPGRGVNNMDHVQQHHHQPHQHHGPSADHHRFGPTRFSVIPRSASGKISIRFVPEQDKEQLVSCIRAHVEHEFAKLRTKNKVTVTVVTSGDWWEAKTESQYFKLAEKALVQEWGQQPLYVREGGTMPLASTLEKVLGAEALLIPMGQASDNCHLANERIRGINLYRGKNVIVHLLREIAKTEPKRP